MYHGTAGGPASVRVAATLSREECARDVKLEAGAQRQTGIGPKKSTSTHRPSWEPLSSQGSHSHTSPNPKPPCQFLDIEISSQQQQQQRDECSAHTLFWQDGASGLPWRRGQNYLPAEPRRCIDPCQSSSRGARYGSLTDIFLHSILEG